MWDQTASYTPRMIAAMTDTMRTTIVCDQVSLRVGQVTLESSTAHLDDEGVNLLGPIRNDRSDECDQTRPNGRWPCRSARGPPSTVSARIVQIAVLDLMRNQARMMAHAA